ncbi:RHS repeat-associated core domain-containing protein, partial [Flaviaesturariibacter aridisoli]
HYYRSGNPSGTLRIDNFVLNGFVQQIPTGSMPITSTEGKGYRYGFNGKEYDPEVYGEGNEQDYGMRIYDPRIGKFLSVDPIGKDFPALTSYQFASNSPVKCIDLDGLEGDPVAETKDWLVGIWDDLTSKKRWVQAARNVNQKFNPLYIAADHISKIARAKDIEGNPIDRRGRSGAVQDAMADGIMYVSGTRFVKVLGAYGTNALEAEINSTRRALNSTSNIKAPANKPALQATTIEETNFASKRNVLVVNNANSLTSEAIVREKLTSNLGPDELILEKPRIYIGDGSSGKYATPDFAVYNRNTGQIVKLVDAKDGLGDLTRAQKQINKYGGIFKGSGRAPEAQPQKIAAGPDAIKIERTNVAQGAH